VKKEELLAYYGREDVSRAISEFAHNREVVGRFADGGYGKRPATILYPGDVVRMVKEGVVSFHCSVELWKNPMALETGKEQRLGWDFLIDLDADTLENGRIAADLIIEALKAHGVRSVFLKFSGRSGFHIFVPWKAFDPKLKDMFPDVPRAMGLYLEDFLREELQGEGVKLGENVNIDSIAIAPRHLVRMPYSLNEKVWMVSIPVKNPWFDIDEARPENVVVRTFRLDAKPGEAMELVDMALNYVKKMEAPRKVVKVKVEGKVPPRFFPPCVKKILEGVPDGRKRGEFILRTLLSNLGWGWEEIEAFLLEWNQRNKPPLKENYIKSHVKWHRKQKRNILPPNCSRGEFYMDTGFCNPDELCKTVRNPLTYTLKKYRRYLRHRKEMERK